MSKKYKYPCTRHIEMTGFGEFLEQECTKSRNNINKFTEELKEKFNVPYITLVNSGSSANLVAALALAEKCKKAGKPLTAVVSAFTFPTTISALLIAGFKLQMVDVEENSFNISVDRLKDLANGSFKLTKSIKLIYDKMPSVIVITHFLGFPSDIKEIVKLAKQHDSFILQDACETLGMKVDSRQIFEYGDITTWSFYHPHHLSAYGGGGVITLNKDDYILVDSIAHWGRACKCHIDEALCTVPAGPAHQFTYERLGINVEMSELNACFGRWQFRSFDEIEKKRIENYNILYEMLKDITNIKIWKAPDIEGSAFVFPIKLKNGMFVNDAYKILSKEDIEIRTLMGGVSNEQKAFKDIFGEKKFPNARDMTYFTFFVGIHQTLSTDDIKYVASKIQEIFQ